jgi:TetR/AcrR family transcriptional regulator, transcriptional repressor for nem operon
MDVKTKILKAGAKIVLEKGFFDTGLAEVLAAAKIPKGSFYFYFKNKEDFGLHLIDYFAERLMASTSKIYRDESLPYIERIRSVYGRQAEAFSKGDYKGGCPIGNLAIEMGDRNDRFRTKLNQVLETMKKRLAGHLARAQELGQIKTRIDINQCANFIISSWEGALMQMKVQKSKSPHEIFDKMIFGQLLR